MAASPSNASPHYIEAARSGDIATVQALRAVACLLVVAYHAAEAWGAAQRPRLLADQVWANGAAGVDLFFVISGFVMAVSSARLAGLAGAWRFVARRLRRVVPLYWMMSAAKLALGAALPASALGAALPALTAGGAWHVLASFLFVPSRDAAGVVRPVLAVGWTLQFEMLFYALFAGVLVLRARRPRVPTLVWLLPPLAGLALAGFFRRPDWPAPLFLANGLVLEFALGLAVASLLDRLARLGWRVGAGLAVTGLVLLLVLPPPGPWRFAAWGMPAALTLAGGVALERHIGARLPRWLLAVGEASYAIYLLHPFLVPVLARLVLSMVPAGLPTGVALAALLAGSLATGTLGGLLLHRSVDRPMQRWLAALRSQKPAFSSADALAHLVQT